MKKDFKRLKLVILMTKEDIVRTSFGFEGEGGSIGGGGNSGGGFDTGPVGSN